MTTQWLILADDLTGAADCAIAFAKQGMDSVVAWGSGAKGGATVLSVDSDSRRFSAAAASQRQLEALALHWRPEMRLYKKIDSTLRGQPAAELAAQLRTMATATKGRAPLAVVAPAFPAAGRVTVDGKVLVNSQPLESTQLWARDHSYPSGDLPEVLGTAGLRSEVIPLAVVHDGVAAVHRGMEEAWRRGADAVVCDCVDLADLDVVAKASLLLDQAVWVGSAGLAVALAALTAPVSAQVSSLPVRKGGVLVVVGSLAEASRAQAAMLADGNTVCHVSVTPATLLNSPDSPEWRAALQALSRALDQGRDVLLEIALADHPDLSQGAELASRLAGLVEQVADRVGAIAATGGDTACALLSRLGVHAIRLVDEVEPGVPFGVTLGRHSFPVVTKAGAFGDTATLRRCVERLKSL